MEQRKLKLNSWLKTFAVLFVVTAILVTACKKKGDDDDTPPPAPTPTKTIPKDSDAGTPPNITLNNLATAIPAASFTSSNNIAKMVITGIKDPVTGNFINLQGTGTGANQTCWLQLDGTNKGILVTKGSARLKSLAVDIAFIVDNSGSMGQEADSVAYQIVSWINYLQTNRPDLSLNVASVGFSVSGDINGALNFTTVQNLSSYLTTRVGYYGQPVTGTYRTEGFAGPDSATLATNAYNFQGQVYDENAIVGLKYGNQFLNWRAGANRVYIVFTDEPTQPNNDTNFCTENFKNTWGNNGTVHVVFSEDTTYMTSYWQPMQNERPWLLATYSGGTSLFVNSSASNLNLNQLPLTGALIETVTIEFSIPTTSKATHDVKLFIKNGTTSDGAREYKGVTF